MSGNAPTMGSEGPSLLLAPSVRTEVVTTTTVTTTTYAPITLPPLPPPPVHHDPKDYPLLNARLPRNLEEFNIVFPDGAQAKFRGNPPIGADGKRGRVIDFTHGAGADIKDETDDEELEVMEGRGWKLLKKEEIPPEEVIDIFTAIERFNRRKRGENAMDGVEMSTPASKKHGHQDGPDRRSGSAESASFARPGQYPGTDRSHGGVARPYAPHPEMLNMNMRGPSGSTTSAAAPPSPLPSPTGSPAPLSFSSPRTHYSPHHPPTPATASMGQPTEHLSSLTAPGRNGHTSTNSTVTSTTGGGVTGGIPLQPDMQLTTLLALPSLLTHFTLLPPNLQSHVILTLLRQSPLPVLRSINSVLAPTLSRDFLTQLPAELVSIVLSYLPGKTLAQCTRVSKAWRAIIDSDPILWRELLRSTGTWFGGGPERAFARTLVNRREVRTGMRLHHHPHNHRNPLRSSILSATSSNSPSTLPSAPLNTLELPHPYKVLFKSRQLTRSQWATNQNPKRVSFAAHGSSVVTCLLFSHNRIISASDDHSIHVYNPLTGQLIKSLEGHGGGVWALAATKDTLVSGSTDRTVRIWDLEKGRCTHVFGGHKSTVRCLAIVKPELLDMVDPNAADGIGMEGVSGDDVAPSVVKKERWPKRTLIVTGSRDHTLRVWKLPKAHEPSFCFTAEEDTGDNLEIADQNPYHLRLLAGHGSAVRALAARGRTLVSGSYDHTVRVWDIITGVCRWVLSGHTQKVYSIVLDHTRNQACSGSMDSSVRIWNLTTGQCVHVLTGHSSLVGLLGLSHSYLVSAAADSTLRVWDPTSGELLHTLAAHTGAITCFQHDEFKILSGSDGTLKMWDIRDGTNVRDLLTGITGVWQVVFDGRWCVAASNRHDATYLDVWDFGEGVVGDGEEEWVGEGSVDGEEGDSEVDEDVDGFTSSMRDSASIGHGSSQDRGGSHERSVSSEHADEDRSWTTVHDADGDEEMAVADHDPISPYDGNDSDLSQDLDDHIPPEHRPPRPSPPPPGYRAPAIEFSPSPIRKKQWKASTSSGKSKLRDRVGTATTSALSEIPSSQEAERTVDWNWSGDAGASSSAVGGSSTPREFVSSPSPSSSAIFGPLMSLTSPTAASGSASGSFRSGGASSSALTFGSASNSFTLPQSQSLSTTPTASYPSGGLVFGSASPAATGAAGSGTPLFSSARSGRTSSIAPSPAVIESTPSPGTSVASPSPSGAAVAGPVSSMAPTSITPVNPSRIMAPPQLGLWGAGGGSSSSSSLSTASGSGFGPGMIHGAGGLAASASLRGAGPARNDDTPSRPSRVRRK